MGHAWPPRSLRACGPLVSAAVCRRGKASLTCNVQVHPRRTLALQELRVDMLPASGYSQHLHCMSATAPREFVSIRCGCANAL